MSFKRIISVIFLVGIASIYFFINPSEVDFLPKCPLYLTTGFYCAGCGSQRATHQLLNLNFIAVLKQNLLYFIALFIFMYHIIILCSNHFFNKKYYNYIYHPKTPIILLFIVFLFWILRNIPYYPFNLLAPH